MGDRQKPVAPNVCENPTGPRWHKMRSRRPPKNEHRSQKEPKGPSVLAKKEQKRQLRQQTPKDKTKTKQTPDHKARTRTKSQPQAHPKASLAQTLCQSSFSRCKFGAMGRAPRGLLNLRLHCKNAIVTVWEKTGEGSAGPGHGWPKFLGEDQGPGPRVGQRLATGLSQGCRAKGWPRAGQRSKPRVQVSGPKDRSRPRAGVRCQGHGQRPPRPLGPPIFTRLVDVY